MDDLFPEKLMAYIAKKHNIEWTDVECTPINDPLPIPFNTDIGDAVLHVIHQLTEEINRVATELGKQQKSVTQYLRNHVVYYYRCSSPLSFYIRSAYVCYLAIIEYRRFQLDDEFVVATGVMREDFRRVPDGKMEGVWAGICDFCETVATTPLYEIAPLHNSNYVGLLVQWYSVIEPQEEFV